LNPGRSYERRRRETIPILYISTEGTTEERYFNMLKSRYAGYSIKIIESKTKNATGVVKNCINRMSQSDDTADRGIAIFDVDENTVDEMEKAFKLAKENRIMVAISNPFFEVWLLMHYQTVPERYMKEDVYKKLLEHLPSYTKTGDLEGIRQNIAEAVSRGYSKYGECGCELVPARCPSTNLHCVVKRIMDGNIDW
jgi:hypothetical protein